MKAELKRKEWVGARLREHEKGEIEKAAEQKRTTLSEWVRDTLLQAARDPAAHAR